MQTQISRQMNALILLIIGIPAIEIYLMIKVGGVIGAFNTILLIFFTAGLGKSKLISSKIQFKLSNTIKSTVFIFLI